MTTAELIKQGEVVFDLRNKLREAEGRAEQDRDMIADLLSAINTLRDKHKALEEAAREVREKIDTCEHTDYQRYCLNCCVRKRLAEVLERK